jgi:hypothetical protein
VRTVYVRTVYVRTVYVRTVYVRTVYMNTFLKKNKKKEKNIVYYLVKEMLIITQYWYVSVWIRPVDACID